MAITDGPVSSEYAGLHQEAELTSTGRISEESVLLKLTTDNEALEDDYVGEIRSLTWDQGLKGNPLTLTLVAWERVGQAADDETISEDSEQMEQPSEQPKIIEEGAGFIVRVGLEGEAWLVYLNGQQKGAFDTEAEAITAALELAQIEREKGYLDPNATLKDGTVNAVQAMFGGFMLGFPFAVGVILIGASIHWMVGKVFGND
jgi:predicted DNA-binding WGR domain protein